MGRGRGSRGWLRAGWLAAVVVPLVLLVGLPADVWHEEHDDDHECAVCHAGHQTADLARPAEVCSSQAPARLAQPPEVRRAVALRLLRRPARAPPGVFCEPAVPVRSPRA
ncbi:MAG: hypothetical protein F4Y71_01180 [Acidobacteria bacterium]|nr:hypothetical protein [Acidobacteriota bacterium]MYG74698.1 hypothetical protein [Acidobacteriota bacterium]